MGIEGVGGVGGRAGVFSVHPRARLNALQSRAEAFLMDLGVGLSGFGALGSRSKASSRDPESLELSSFGTNARQL